MNNWCTWHFEQGGVRWVKGKRGRKLTFPTWNMCRRSQCTDVSHLARRHPCRLQRALMPQSLTWGGLPGRQQDGSKGAAAPCGDGPGSCLVLRSHPCSPRPPLAPFLKEHGSLQWVRAARLCLGLHSAAQSHAFVQPSRNFRSHCTGSTETLPKPGECHS